MWKLDDYFALCVENARCGSLRFCKRYDINRSQRNNIFMKNIKSTWRAHFWSDLDEFTAVYHTAVHTSEQTTHPSKQHQHHLPKAEILVPEIVNTCHDFHSKIVNH